jgi:poly(3-hydroxybutyrate) depolymerase
MPGMTPNGPGSRWSRRRVLTLGLAPVAVLACAAAGGAELVSRGVLPGRTLLQELDGACSVPAPPLAFSPLGPSADGTFYSAARRRTVGYTIAYPPGHRQGDELPLVVMLHAYGGNHAHALAGMSPAQAVALRSGGRPLTPIAMVGGRRRRLLEPAPRRRPDGDGDR